MSEQLFNPRAADRYSLVRTETYGIRWEAFLIRGALLPQEKGKQVIKWPGRLFTEKNEKYVYMWNISRGKDSSTPVMKKA